MAGLLGMMVAGGAKGYADQRVKEIEAQQAFDMRKALIEAESDMRIRAEREGIKLKEQAMDNHRAKIKGILDQADAADPNAGKGGYETEEMKTKSARDKATRRRDALRNAGYLDESNTYSEDLKQTDNTAAKEGLLSLKEAQLNETIRNNTERHNAQMRELHLKGEANAAKAQAAAAGAAKESEQDKLYRAYVERVRREGAPDGKGRISKVPFSRDKWNEMQLDKAAARKAKSDSEREEVEYDSDGAVRGRKVIKTGKPANRPITTNDPLGLRR